MDDLAGLGQRPQAGRSAAVKAWVQQMLELPADATVMLSELKCSEPGCPPVETVIAIFGAGRDARQYKVHKPMDEVEPSDIESLKEHTHDH